MRFFLEFSYSGKNYHGWQRQPNAISVQEVIEDSLKTILRDSISLTAAGRTDTGVHARQMFAHFDANIEKGIISNLVYELNQFLPHDVVIESLCPVREEAHARFDAISRTYEYHISKYKNAFENDFHYFFKNPLDLELMNKASKIILDHQDFKCFSKSNSDVKTYICNISEAYWKNSSQGYIFTISSNRFLRNMVRAIVGTLLEIGLKKKTLKNLEYILNSRDRSLAGFSAPSKGLFLIKVEYPKSIFLQI